MSREAPPGLKQVEDINRMNSSSIPYKQFMKQQDKQDEKINNYIMAKTKHTPSSNHRTSASSKGLRKALSFDSRAITVPNRNISK